MLVLTVLACQPPPGLVFRFGPDHQLLYVFLGINVAALIIGLVVPHQYPYPVIMYWLAFLVGSAINVGGYIATFDVISPSRDALSIWLSHVAPISGCYAVTNAQFLQQSAFLDHLRYASLMIEGIGNEIALVPAIVTLVQLTPYARRLTRSDQSTES